MKEKIIKGFKNYTINECGIVKNINTNKILKRYTNKWGYLEIYLYNNSIKKRFFIHRLVAYHFIKINKNKLLQINHKDGNKLNNHYKNLEWITESKNRLHGFKIGLYNVKGSKNSNHLLNEEQVKNILEAYNYNGVSQHDLRILFKVSKSVINNIIHARSWKHITTIFYKSKSK